MTPIKFENVYRKGHSRKFGVILACTLTLTLLVHLAWLWARGEGQLPTIRLGTHLANDTRMRVGINCLATTVAHKAQTTLGRAIRTETETLA